MNIRMLTEADVTIFQVIRLRALQDNPEAFGSTYEESKDFSLDKKYTPPGSPLGNYVV